MQASGRCASVRVLACCGSQADLIRWCKTAERGMQAMEHHAPGGFVRHGGRRCQYRPGVLELVPHSQKRCGLALLQQWPPRALTHRWTESHGRRSRSIMCQPATHCCQSGRFGCRGQGRAGCRCLAWSRKTRWHQGRVVLARDWSTSGQRWEEGRARCRLHARGVWLARCGSASGCTCAAGIIARPSNAHASGQSSGVFFARAASVGNVGKRGRTCVGIYSRARGAGEHGLQR